MARKLEGKHGLYFESVLQLRDVSERIVDFAEAEIVRLKLRIARTEKVKNGLDYYLSDNALTKKLGREIQGKFGGQTLTTASLWGVKQDREVYRTTVLYRGVNFKKGNIVEYEGELHHIVFLGVKDIMMQNNKTGKKVHLKYKNMGEIKLFEP